MENESTNLNNNLNDSTHQLEPTVILDPTGLYKVPESYTLIATDVDWLRHFGIKNSPWWVRGKHLCNWSQEWLRSRNCIHWIVARKQHPRQYLENLLNDTPIPKNLTNQELLDLVAKLNTYQNDPIASFLAEVTESNPQIWMQKPTVENLAAWLEIEVPPKYKFLEDCWKSQFVDSELKDYYKTQDKLQLLRRWIGIAEPPLELGRYPFAIPKCLQTEFDRYWRQKLEYSPASELDTLLPNQQAGMERIAEIASEVFQKQPEWLNKAREAKISPYLNRQKHIELQKLQPPLKPEPISADTPEKEVLKWTTEEYLPFRRWELTVQQAKFHERTSDDLAESFSEWLYQQYPKLKITPVAESFLNYNTAYRVQTLCQQHPVLWVVVDGLGWLDHQELLSYLTEGDSQLSIENDLEPRFSILPTKTEYAKWSLYAQMTPRSVDWSKDIKKAFQTLNIGKYYSDNKLNHLYKDLKENKYQLYCWDTIELDKCYHNQSDWQTLYEVERLNILRSIASKIQYCLKQYPEPERLKVAISSDHGQLLGDSPKMTHCPPEIQPQGRMAIGKTNDLRFFVLERDRFELPHDVSIVKSSETLSSFSYTQEQNTVGSHGGLFPEEVVVGFSVLCYQIQRSPVSVICRGRGKANQPGEIQVDIYNPNSVSLTDLYLYINQIADYQNGKPIKKVIPPSYNEKSFSLIIPISAFPELPPNQEGKQLKLSGKLDFKYAELERGSVDLHASSMLTIEQMFSSGFDIDEFL